MKALLNTEAAYLAGLIDGEGSIGIYHNGQSLVGRALVDQILARKADYVPPRCC